MLLHIIILLSYNHEFAPKNWELKKMVSQWGSSHLH